ncbi:MAG: chromosome segregation protein SMC [Acidobacteriota bacterium]
MLTLKRIVIQGFKSFADKSEMFFAGSGIAAIVGPNGCGKSNISDAIAWVLGEQSAKSLRGGRMEDVIFNGTRSRLPLGMAEVTLTLVDPEVSKEANWGASPREPIEPSESESDEEVEPLSEEAVEMGSTAAAGPVTVATKRKKRPRFQPKPGELVVSRRLFRSGDSEYLINGRLVRLRDVQDIFMGTGLGPDSYAIIEQGRVGMLLSSKPSDRRAVIEEAAGITRFKSKRKLAESKLEQAKQNLLRVNDITEEVSKQLGSLKRQASKARRYRELREQLRDTSRRLFSGRSLVLAAQLQECEQNLRDVLDRHQDVHRRIQDKEAQHEQGSMALTEIETALQRTREAFSQLNLDSERNQQRVQFQKQQLVELQSRFRESGLEIERLAQQEQSVAEEVRVKQAALEEATRNFDRAHAEYQAQDSRSQGLHAGVSELESRIEQSQARLLEAVGEVATARNQLTQLDDVDKRLQGQIERLTLEQTSNEENRQALSSEHQAALRDYQERQGREQQLTAQITGLSEALRGLKEEESRTRALLEASKEQYLAHAHRLKSLEELAAHHAYSTEAVRLLLSTARESNNGPFHTAGILADLIEVDSPYEAVVEELLRQELEFIFVDSAADAHEGISLLRKTSAGRSTFLRCRDVQSRSEAVELDRSVQALTESDPSLIPVSRVIRLPEGYREAAVEALPQLFSTVIVPDYSKARELAGNHPTLTFLTLEGEILRGRLITGGGKASGGHLSLRREIRELEQSLGLLQSTTTAHEQQLLEFRQSIETRENDLNAAQQARQQLEKELVGSELRVKQLQAELERIGQRARLADLELQRLKDEKSQVQDRRLHLRDSIHAIETTKSETEAGIAGLHIQLKDLKAKAASDSELLSELRSDLAAFRERKLSAENELIRLRAGLTDCQERLSRLRSQTSAWQEQSDQIQQSIKETEETLFRQSVQKASLEAEIRSRENELAAARTLQSELEQHLRQLRAELEGVQDQKTSVEIQRAKLGSELTHLHDTCTKELHLSLEELQSDSTVQVELDAIGQLESEYQEIKERIEAMGPVNMMALEEFQECEQRFQFLSTQRQDLLDSIEDTTAAIKEIDQVSREQFREAFSAINTNFQETFKNLFGGGHGEMKLLDEQDELDSGIEIIAQPPGKRLQNVLLLSGGEKALTAIALLLAIFKYQPSPFCVLDEVDAPLDEINTGRFSQMIKVMSQDTQFILITHSKKTMEVADKLYGVTMQEAGISKLVSVQFE